MVETDNRSRLKQWLESGEARLHPLTFPQRELWETSPVAVDDCANHICATLQITGALTPEQGEAALQQVVDRQEVMRLSFLPGRDRPLQMVRSSVATSFRFRDLAPHEVAPEAMEPLLQEVYRQPFDLVQGPLYRIEMMRRSPTDHVMAFAIHHGIADGWSLGVFVQDLAAAYMGAITGRLSGRAGLPPVPQTHSEWAAGERTFWQPAELARHADYWRSHLGGSRPLWSDRDGTARGAGPLQRWVCAFPADQTRALRDLAARRGATLFSTLLAAFQLSLWKWSGRDDLVVGTPVANRHREAVRQTMGYFAGIVPLRGQVSPALAFSGHLDATHARTVDSFAHAIPFAELAKLLEAPGGPGRHSLFDVRFALQNHPVPDITLPRISTRLRMRSTGTARFDLGCEVTESGQELEVVWLHRQSMLAHTEVAELDRIFRAVLVEVGRNPDCPCHALVP